MSIYLYSTFECMLLSCHEHVSEWTSPYSCLNVNQLLALKRDIWSWKNCNWTRTHSHLRLKGTLHPLAKLIKWLSCVVSTYLYVHLSVCSYHLTYVFQNKFTLYSRLNSKVLLDQKRVKIWSLRDCNWTQTDNHFVCKRTLNHLAKLSKWLSCIVTIYLYDTFKCMLLSCHLRHWKWIHTL